MRLLGFSRGAHQQKHHYLKTCKEVHAYDPPHPIKSLHPIPRWPDHCTKPDQAKQTRQPSQARYNTSQPRSPFPVALYTLSGILALQSGILALQSQSAVDCFSI